MTESSTQTPVSTPESVRLTHIVVLLDRSGSMESIATDVIGGYNQFLKDQLENGLDAKVTLVQFDDENSQEIIHDAVGISDVPRLSAKEFIPRGSTPLLDATGRLIARIRERQATDTRPTDQHDDIVFVTITDGQENCSHEYSLVKTREMIANCEQDGWTFVFLSAGLDAYGEASGMGVQSGRTRAFRANKAGTDAAFMELSANMTVLREKKRRRMDTTSDAFFDDAKVDRILGDD
jgi:Mg-chelatase subunit ChlD